MKRDEDQRESRRILERVGRESEAGSLAARTARRARDHVTAVDADRDDWTEVWGTRIGRVLGIVIVLMLMLWLILHMLRGG